MNLATEVIDGLEVHVAGLAASAGKDFTTATDLADRLVLDGGLDYRSAYRVVARAVSEAVGGRRGACVVRTVERGGPVPSGWRRS